MSKEDESIHHHTFDRVAPHVYRLSPSDATDRPALGVVAGRERTLVVDAGNSPAHARLLLGRLQGLRVPPVSFVAVTHWHWDHVFGLSAFDAPAVAHSETRHMVAEMARWDWSDEALDRRVAEGVEIAFCRDNIIAELPDRSGLVLRPPEIAFHGRVEIDLGGVRCNVVHVGGDHAADASVVYVPEDRVLFIGDCLGPDLYSGEPSYTTGRLFPLLDRLLGFDAEWFVEGHESEPAPRQAIVEYAHLLRAAGEAVLEAGPGREAVLAALAKRLPGPVDSDVAEMVDQFLAGQAKVG